MKNNKNLNLTVLGNTDISTSSIGLGLAALGRPGYINLGHAADLDNNYDLKRMEKRSHQVLDRAWEMGVRYFDVARSYGRAEHFLASWLNSRQIKANEVTVGSKWGYTYMADWKTNAEVHEIKEHSTAVLKKQWQESQEHLAGWLKLYQIHSATMASGVLDDSKLLNILAQIKSENIVIGLSLSGTKQAETLEKALTVEIDGRRLFDAVQVTWNLLETSAEKALQIAHKQGIGVIIKEGLANGRLTARNNEADFKSTKTLLSNIARKHNTKIDALALGYILKQPWAHIVLSGATTIEQLESNMQATELINLADINIAEKPELYWHKRSALSWN